MTIHHADLITYYSSALLENDRVKHGFFMRHGGCSPKPWESLNLATSVGDTRANVIENRRRLCNGIHIPPESIYDVWQVHSREVVYASQPRQLDEPHLQADAIMTDQSEVSILMLFADCVPILLYDPVRHVIACAHAGWQGTIKKVAQETVKAMQNRFACKPQDLIALIGPCICADHFAVGEEIFAAARGLFHQETKVYYQHESQFHLNLPLANRILLEQAGVGEIESVAICTQEHNQDWFSHRAEKGKTGRFGAIISLR